MRTDTWQQLEQLCRLLDRGMYDGVAFTLECRNAFEPHGRASETWETDWLVTLPDVQAHWRGADGQWHPCKEGLVAAFHDRTAYGALAQAIRFLTESGVKQKLTSPATKMAGATE